MFHRERIIKPTIHGKTKELVLLLVSEYMSPIREPNVTILVVETRPA